MFFKEFNQKKACKDSELESGTMVHDTMDNKKIYNKEALIDYLAQGCKPATQWRIGTEHEKFPFYVDGNLPVPYGGKNGIHVLLEGMQSMLGWEPVMDAGNIIGLVEPTGSGAISLEPGGQFELSGAPLATIHQTYREVQAHLAQIHEIATPLGIRFLGIGASPEWTLDGIPSMPKSRYKIMKAYMPRVGHHGLDMMYRTATIQVNLDFSSEKDMRRKMQISMKLQPVATALFASSPFTEGKPNGLLSWRSEIWRYTDNNRTGILPFVFSPKFGFDDYVEWALDIPMYFVLRDGHYYDTTDITFRQFMNGALKDRIPDSQPIISDWINHLSTLFPEVRLKRFLEMRGSDGGPGICALPAYWVGLLYDDEALTEAETLVKDWTYPEVKEMRDHVPAFALKTPFRNITLLELARETLKISRKGLEKRHHLNQKGHDETLFLESLEETIMCGKTTAEKMLSEYHNIWNASIEPIFLKYAC
ncbi:MAG: glutamate--cysteine ligase [Candidatus Tokpelaia sp. JSC085]|nr:MAG: glutamate--cysteine ligase [Candidatus Tokpelaia sp. JSC085]